MGLSLLGKLVRLMLGVALASAGALTLASGTSASTLAITEFSSGLNSGSLPDAIVAGPDGHRRIATKALSDGSYESQFKFMNSFG